MIDSFEIKLDNEANTSNDEVEEMVALACLLKTEQYDFKAIFDATGLQPEIIQSL